MAVRNGVRLPVSFGEVFPHGCLFVPGSAGAVEDFDENTRVRTPAFDKFSGEPVWSVRVIDLDPELGTRARETVVKIAAPVQPVPPAAEVCPVEFDGLTVTPYVNDKGRIAFSFRATNLRAPASGGRKPAAETDGKAA
jgi:hypothetical protein